MRKFTFAALAFGAVVAANAQFSAGNLVVVRFGDGAAALGTTACAVFLEQFTTAGAHVNTTNMPQSVSGSNRAFTNRGSATSEGALTRSVNGQYLLLAGYDTAPGSANPSTATSAAVNRVIARVNGSATVDTTTALNDSYSGDSIRGACSTDGNDLWTFGTGSVAASAGIRYTTYGSSTATQLGSPPTNIRRGAIYNGQLYVSSASSTFQGVSQVGTGLPTTPGQSITILPGFPTSAGPSNYDFVFVGTSTIYVADDRAVASGGGIQKWTFDGFSWSLQYTLTVNLGAGCRSLVVNVAEESTTIYAVTAENPSRLVRVVDNGPLSEFFGLASAGTNQAFRGLAWAPQSDAPRTVSGTVDLQDWAADLATPEVTFEIYPTGGGSLLETHTLNLTSGGDYIFTTDLAPGTYDMFCRGSHWLWKLESLTITGTGGTQNFSVVNGDCDGDNEVTLVDYGIMSASFGKAEGDAGYDSRADLDGDLEINLGDAAIISARFGQAGDSY